MENPNQPKGGLAAPDNLNKAVAQDNVRVIHTTDTHVKAARDPATVDTDKPEKPPLWAKIAIGAGLVGVVLLGIAVGKRSSDEEEGEGILHGEKVKTTVKKAKNTAKRTEEWAEDKPVAHQVVGVTREAAAKVEAAAHSAAHTVGSGVEKAAHGAKDAGHAIKEKGQDLGDKLTPGHKAEGPFWSKWFGGK